MADVTRPYSAFGVTIASTVRTLTFADGDGRDRLRHPRRSPNRSARRCCIAIKSGPAAVGDAITGGMGDRQPSAAAGERRGRRASPQPAVPSPTRRSLDERVTVSREVPEGEARVVIRDVSRGD